MLILLFPPLLTYMFLAWWRVYYGPEINRSNEPTGIENISRELNQLKAQNKMLMVENEQLRCLRPEISSEHAQNKQATWATGISLEFSILFLGVRRMPAPAWPLLLAAVCFLPCACATKAHKQPQRTVYIVFIGQVPRTVGEMLPSNPIYAYRLCFRLLQS